MQLISAADSPQSCVSTPTIRSRILKGEWDTIRPLSPGTVSTPTIRSRILKVGLATQAPGRSGTVSTPTIRSRILKAQWTATRSTAPPTVSTPTIRSRILKDPTPSTSCLNRTSSFNPNDPFEDTESSTSWRLAATVFGFQPQRSVRGY